MKPSKRALYGAAALVAGLVFLGCFELIGWLFFQKALALTFDERNLTYRYDERLGWFPRENTSGYYEGSVRIKVAHNREGFRDVEHPPTDRPAMIFLGDSYVWGYDVEVEDRFTDLLKPRLPGWEILNFGVSGYGTAQELLLLREHIDRRRPKVVFLVFQELDILDNSSNQFYGYYRPYFETVGDKLELRGVPVPKSIHYYQAEHKRLFSASYLARALSVLFFRAAHPPVVSVPDPTKALLRELQSLVSKSGGTLFVGLEGDREEGARYCEELAIPFVRLSNSMRFEGHGRHWTKEGNAWVASRIEAFLKSEPGFH